MMSHVELERQALNLSARDRAELAHKLLSSLKDLSESELEQLWALEAKRRLEAFDRGEMESFLRVEMQQRVKAALVQ